MPSSWQVRLATILAGLNVVFGVGVLVAVVWSFTQDPGILFAVYPAIAGAVATGGAWLTATSISHTSKLRKGASDARLQTLAVGLSCLTVGVGLLLVVPWLGLLLVVDGVTMAAVMMTHAARRELGPWVPEGSFWPRSHRAYPGMAPSRAGTSSDARPWWERLGGELSRGLPAWVVVVGSAAVLFFLATGVLLLRDGGVFGLASATTLLVGTVLAWPVYRHLRARVQA